MDDADMLRVLIFVFFLPLSLIYLAGRWIIRRTKANQHEAALARRP